MKKQMQWSEYIKDHIEHKLWMGEKLDKSIIAVRNSVKDVVLESVRLDYLIFNSATDCDCHTLGHDMKILFETELLAYCEDNAEDLQDVFPEEWQEYKDSGLNGDEVDT